MWFWCFWCVGCFCVFCVEEGRGEKGTYGRDIYISNMYIYIPGERVRGGERRVRRKGERKGKGRGEDAEGRAEEGREGTGGIYI